MRTLAVSFFILVLGLFGLLNPVRNFTQHTFAPVQFGLRKTAFEIKDAFRFFVNLKKLRLENLKLLQENSNLKAAVLNLKEAEEENLLLRDQLQLRNKKTFDKELLLANVLGNANDLSGTTVILDEGSRHGIKTGNNVIVGNYLVGVVKDVSSERSLVSLIISPDVSITATDIDAAGKTEGLAVGQYGTSIEVKRILPDEDINVGDTIITSGKDGLFEPGLSLGKVVKVIQNPSDPLKSAYIETLLDLSRLQKVFVILN